MIERPHRFAFRFFAAVIAIWIVAMFALNAWLASASSIWISSIRRPPSCFAEITAASAPIEARSP